jgi:hypothetical protein
VDPIPKYREHQIKFKHRNGTFELRVGTSRTTSAIEKRKCKSFVARKRDYNPIIRKN